MVINEFKGRFINKLIQYLAASIFAEKNNLFLLMDNELEPFITAISGEEKYNDNTIMITDDNFLYYLSLDVVPKCQYIFLGYYQHKKFFSIYENEIRKRIKIIEPNIRGKNEFVIHLRLYDNPRKLPMSYYVNAIEELKRKNVDIGYVITDEPNNPISSELISKYGLQLVNVNQYYDFTFALSFSNIILSGGTYSFMIGYLSNAENILYHKTEGYMLWHGDIFLHDKWKNVNY